MTGSDFDGVHCDVCHTMYNPFFETTHAGTREGADWLNYWDETNASVTPSQPATDAACLQDALQAQNITLFNGGPFYSQTIPFATTYTENASGQYFVSANADERAPFADAAARHAMGYSRYHKSRYFCSTCHDVSNPVLDNLAFDGTLPGDGTTILPSEANPAYSYYHVERTSLEFTLSDYGQQGGTPGIGPFATGVFATSRSNNYIATCQDCHLNDTLGKGANKQDSVLRPTGSTVTLYYQTASREYIQFLRDQINGTGNLTLSSPTPSGEPNAYIIIDSEMASILLLDEQTGKLRFIAARTFPDQLGDILVPIEGSIAGDVFSSGRPLIIPNVRADPRHYKMVDQLIPDVEHYDGWVYSRPEHTWIKSYIGAPFRL